MWCPKCGELLPEGSLSCNKCGFEIDISAYQDNADVSVNSIQTQTDALNEQPKAEDLEIVKVNEQPKTEVLEKEVVNEQPKTEALEKEVVNEQPKTEDLEIVKVDEQPKVQQTAPAPKTNQVEEPLPIADNIDNQEENEISDSDENKPGLGKKKLGMVLIGLFLISVVVVISIVLLKKDDNDDSTQSGRSRRERNKDSIEKIDDSNLAETDVVDSYDSEYDDEDLIDNHDDETEDETETINEISISYDGTPEIGDTVVIACSVDSNNCSWKSSNNSVVVVKDGGVARIVGYGSAYVYAEYEGMVAQCYFNIPCPFEDVVIYEDQITLKVDELYTLTTNYTNENIHWDVTDKDIALVDNGTIRAVACGETYVYLYFEINGEEYKRGCNVTVVPKEIIPEDLSRFVKKVSASSTLKEKTIIHSAENVLDGNKKTCWSEAAEGYGKNEYILIRFSKKMAITELDFVNGYMSKEKTYNKNGRLAKIKIAYDGGSKVVVLKDLSYKKASKLDYTDSVIFDEPVETDYVKVYIKSVYEGTECEDTCVSEIRAMGYEID